MSVLVCLGAGCVFSDNSTEALKIRSIRVTREELRRDDEGVSIDHFSDGDIGVVFGSGSEAEENPGKLRNPGGVLTTGHEGGFQGPMHTFDEAIGFGVVCSRLMMNGAEELG